MGESTFIEFNFSKIMGISTIPLGAWLLGYLRCLITYHTVIRFTVHMLSSFGFKTCQISGDATKHPLLYIADTTFHGVLYHLWYKIQSGLCDYDWAGNPDTCWSTSELHKLSLSWILITYQQATLGYSIIYRTWSRFMWSNSYVNFLMSRNVLNHFLLEFSVAKDVLQVEYCLSVDSFACISNWRVWMGLLEAFYSPGGSC